MVGSNLAQAAKGFYFDLGAFKPLECSNSAKFDIEFGWKGIVVEPRTDMGFYLSSERN